MAKISDEKLVSLFFKRLLMATILVVATYNPTPFSLLSYLGGQLGSADIFDAMPIKAIALIVFGIFWWIFLKTAYHSLKGIALAFALILMLGAYILLNEISSLGYTMGSDVLIWLALAIVSLLLGTGATASHIKMRWSGIRNVDTVDDHN